MDLNSIKIDKQKMSEGVWVDCGDGLRLKLASTQSPEYKAFLVKKLRRARRGGVGAMIEITAQVTTEALAEYVIRDWEGLTQNGEPVQYSKQMAKRLLEDFPRFRSIVDEALDEDMFLEAEETEETAGNSSGS